jgi:hypothetical protein
LANKSKQDTKGCVPHPKALCEDKVFSVALENIPDFASRIGVFLSYFAIAEGYVHHLIGKLTGVSEGDASVFSGAFQNFGMRIQLLNNLTENRPVGDRAAVIAKYFVERLDGARNIRNEYAHATYSFGYEGNTHTARGEQLAGLITGIHDWNKVQSTKPLTLAKINRDIGELRQLVCEMHAYVYRDEAPTLPGEAPPKLVLVNPAGGLPTTLQDFEALMTQLEGHLHRLPAALIPECQRVITATVRDARRGLGNEIRRLNQLLNQISDAARSGDDWALRMGFLIVRWIGTE